jgi:EmrB/QacA subfamily drug resistance transporter
MFGGQHRIDEANRYGRVRVPQVKKEKNVGRTQLLRRRIGLLNRMTFSRNSSCYRPASLEITPFSDKRSTSPVFVRTPLLLKERVYSWMESWRQPTRSASVGLMKTPRDEAVIRSTATDVPCATRRRRWILAATILGSSMAFIDSTVVNVALPALQASLGATIVGVQWVVESYALLLAALILVGGSLGDLFGRRRMFLVGVGIFAAASIACGLSLNIQQLVIARCVQGVGAAFLVPGSLSIISASFDEQSRGQAIGTWSGFTAITTAVGPVLGGLLIEYASWRWAFFINVPLAAAATAISLRHVPESRNASAGQVDWLGTLVVTAGLGGVVYGFIESTNLGWSNPLVFGSLIGGFACLIGFPLVETRISSPMVPLALFNSRSFSGANLITLFLYAALGIFFFLFPLNLIQVQGYSTAATGAAALPFILLMFLLSRWSGGLITRYGPKPPLVTGPLVAAAGFVLFAVPSAGAGYWKSFFPAFVVLGLGMAISVAPLTTVVMSSSDQNRAGTASGINNAVARVASVIAVAILGIVMVRTFGWVLDRSLRDQLLPRGVFQYIQSNAIKLAGLDLPAGLGADMAAVIRAAISHAFVFGFRVEMFICAGLSLASGAVAWLLLPVKVE